MTKIWLIFFFLFHGIAHSAQLVCIGDGTYHVDLNHIGDIVAIHEDDVQLGGPGYNHFIVYKIKEKAAIVQTELAKKLPDTSTLTKEEIKERLSTPKYQFRVVNNKEAAVADMCDTNVVLSPAEIMP